MKKSLVLLAGASLAFLGLPAVTHAQAASGPFADVPTDPWPPLLDMDEPDASVERLPVELAGTVPRLWRQLELGLRDPTIASQRRR